MRALLLVFAVLLASCGTSQQPTQYSAVRATGSGQTLQVAKEAAFRRAIEERVGVIVLGERAIREYQLVKDEILAYSAGYVDDYRIVNQVKNGGLWRVTADIWVSNSRIANRIFTEANAAGELPSVRAADSYGSFIEQRRQADRLLTKLLDGFPADALTVQFKGSSLEFDEERNALMTVRYDLRWSQNYLISLSEILSQIGNRSSAKAKSNRRVQVKYQDPKDWFGTLDRFYFADKKLFQQIKKQLERNNVGIKIQMLDDEKVLFEECWLDSSWTRDNGVVSTGWSTVTLNGWSTLRRSVTYTFTTSASDQAFLRSAKRIEFRLIPGKDCKR